MPVWKIALNIVFVLTKFDVQKHHSMYLFLLLKNVISKCCKNILFSNQSEVFLAVVKQALDI